MSNEPTVQQLFDLSGRTALVSGASGYLGSSFSRALAEAGANVVCTSRDLGRAEAAAAALPRNGDTRHHAVVLDHMDEASLFQGFDDAVKCTGQIDILINNGHDALGHDWTDATGEEFTRQQANATGYFLLARRLREHLVERGTAGNVVMLGSMYGQVASYPDAYAGLGMASSVAYHCLKGGIIHMTRHLAIYWADDGVRVNCLSPGPFPSPKADGEMVERLVTKSPMRRMGVPHELNGALLLLVSDAGSYITGENITVDGGWTAW